MEKWISYNANFTVGRYEPLVTKFYNVHTLCPEKCYYFVSL